jgi:hypothetical protein
VNVQHISSPVCLIDKGSPLAIQRTYLPKASVANNSSTSAAADAAGNPSWLRVCILAKLKLENHVIAAFVSMSSTREQHRRTNGSKNYAQHHCFCSTWHVHKPNLDSGEMFHASGLLLVRWLTFTVFTYAAAAPI